MIRYVIALYELGVKNKNLIFLLKNYSSNIVEMFNNRAIINDRLELVLYKEFFSSDESVNEALEKADALLIQNKKLDIKSTYYGADTYPPNLMLIDNPPAIIYYKGAEFSDISNKAIACVGTRKPTRLSYNAVNYLVPQWVNENCSIISGLACGVDKLSHQACISSGGKTIAVLAHGLDTIYPKENKALAERIISSGGILMSEYPVGIKAEKHRFVNRNRLIVGLSNVVVIYECNENGGTMHNAEFAKQQNKPIFCPAVGEEVLEIQTGTKKLLDEHIASVIEQGRDIESVLSVFGTEVLHARMSNYEIKKDFLHALISIVDSNRVVDKTIRDLNISIANDDKLFKNFVSLIENGEVNIDNLLNSLIINNIASVNKALQFEN